MTPQSSFHSPRYKWWVIAMLWFVCFFNYADRQAIYSVFPKLAQDFGFDTVQLGLIGSAFMWLYAGGAPFAGFICDRFRRKDLILGGCLFWSFITIATGWCAKLKQFITVRALEGLGETFYFPASMSLASDYHGQRTRSRALSFHQSSVYVGTILGSWLGAWFAENLGWQTGFYFFGTMGMLLALVLYKFLLEPVRGQGQDTLAVQQPQAISSANDPGGPGVQLLSHVGQRFNLQSPAAQFGGDDQTTARILSVLETLRVIFRSPTVPLLMLAFLCANFVATIFLTWTPTFLVDKFHFKLTHAGLSGALFIHLASAASVPLAGWLADQLASRFKGGRMLVQGLGLLAGAGFVFLVGKTYHIATLLTAMTVFGLCKGFYDSGIFASLYDAIEPRARGSAAGLMNTVGWGGGALGPLFVGLVSKYGRAPTQIENMSDAIAFGGAVYVLAAVLVALAIVTYRRGPV